MSEYVGDEPPECLQSYSKSHKNQQLSNLKHLSLSFQTITQFENFLLLSHGLKQANSKHKLGLIPKSLEKLSIKLDFNEFVIIDEYYSQNLIPEIFTSESLREVSI